MAVRDVLEVYGGGVMLGVSCWGLDYRGGMLGMGC